MYGGSILLLNNQAKTKNCQIHPWEHSLDKPKKRQVFIVTNHNAHLPPLQLHYNLPLLQQLVTFLGGIKPPLTPLRLLPFFLQYKKKQYMDKWASQHGMRELESELYRNPETIFNMHFLAS